MSGMAGPGDSVKGGALVDTETRYLTHHTPDEWRVATFDRLVDLGCSVEYAKEVSDRINDETFTYVGHPRKEDS